MSKNNARLKHFFEGKRRKCNLSDYRQLKSKAGERRMKLMVSMPLSNNPVMGIPEAFAEEYALMEREKSSVNLSKISVELEGALFTIFTTDTSSRPTVKTNGATLTAFRLIGNGVEDKRTVDLEFTVYLSWTESLRDWCGDHQHADFFAETVPSQMELVDAKPVGKLVIAKKGKFDPDAIKKAAKSGELVN